MKINVTAKPSSKKAYIKKLEGNEYIVSVKEPPIHGLANLSIASALSDFFDVPARQVRIVTGYKSKNKVFEIEGASLSPKE